MTLSELAKIETQAQRLQAIHDRVNRLHNAEVGS
jgi:hypothetical protein